MVLALPPVVVWPFVKQWYIHTHSLSLTHIPLCLLFLYPSLYTPLVCCRYIYVCVRGREKLGVYPPCYHLYACHLNCLSPSHYVYTHRYTELRRHVSHPNDRKCSLSNIYIRFFCFVVFMLTLLFLYYYSFINAVFFHKRYGYLGKNVELRYTHTIKHTINTTQATTTKHREQHTHTHIHITPHYLSVVRTLLECIFFVFLLSVLEVWLPVWCFVLNALFLSTHLNDANTKKREQKLWNEGGSSLHEKQRLLKSQLKVWSHVCMCTVFTSVHQTLSQTHSYACR